MTEINDLRFYISALEALGDVQRISRVIDPNLEASAVTRRSTENGRPAPFFEHLSGVDEGFRMIGAPGALSSVPGYPLARVSLSLGLPYTTTTAELVEHLRQAGTKQLLPPRRVTADSAPCKQNILMGEEARLDRFPIPFVHQSDGGPYVNTWGVIVAQTPDGRWTNWSRHSTVSSRQLCAPRSWPPSPSWQATPVLPHRADCGAIDLWGATARRPAVQPA